MRKEYNIVKRKKFEKLGRVVETEKIIIILIVK